ncbi:MAG: hypothetical protein HXY53_03070 [Nitrospirae bacterium]|nr:hypothetical protein [Nitrospirota bacterium]
MIHIYLIPLTKWITVSVILGYVLCTDMIYATIKKGFFSHYSSFDTTLFQILNTLIPLMK